MKKKSWKITVCRLLLAGVVLCETALLSGCHGAPPVTREELVTDITREVGTAGEVAAIGETAATGVPEVLAIEEDYLGGAELHLLACANGAQNLSCVIRTRGGSVIVVDGGRDIDAEHLTEVIQSMGGRVAAWLITHPHSDHIGALTELLNTEPGPIAIDQIYYSFLENSVYETGENQGRMEDLTSLQEAFQKLEERILHPPVKKGDTFQVDEARITVMNEPFACQENTFNNSSVAYRLEINDKRILFLGDMGWQAGENLLKVCTPEELKADVVQMAHHGQAGVEKDVYEVISPEICLWPTPQWLWDNELDGVAGAGPYHTLTVRRWMEELGVEKNLSVKDGDQTLK